MNAPLFANNKERAFFLGFLIIIFTCVISHKYFIFHKLSYEKTPKVDAKVVLQYKKIKNNKEYFVLKLKSSFGYFYTTSKEDLANIQDRNISLRIIFKNISFIDFLSGFYAPSFNLILLQDRSIQNTIKSFILKQHNEEMMQKYYLSLLLADPLPNEWRSLAQDYGISHIFAISGYHVGILSMICIFVVGLIYTPLHKRYFPYRNKFYDIGMIVLVVLFAYYLLLTQSPSYLRAIALYGIGFLLFYTGRNIIKIETLFWCVAILIALFPNLIFSIGFYFSSMGVLYIMLFYKYVKIENKMVYLMIFNIAIFINMTIITYYFFPQFSPLSLLSVIITPIFAIYYPIMLASHVIGCGDIFDQYLLQWLSIPTKNIQLPQNTIIFITANIISILAIFHKKSYYVLIVLNSVFYIYALFQI